MIRRRFIPGALMVAGGLLVAGALTLPTAPAQADSFGFAYSSGYYPRHHHRHHYHGPRVVYVAPPPVYYYPPPPPRVVYYPPPPPPAYVVPAPPVVMQAPPPAYQTLPGGRLAQNIQCREYQSTAIVDGRQVPSYGTACLQPDGSWQIVR